MPDASTIGREPIIIVAIDQDRCTLTYGVAPCAAVLGETGEHKCYNTFRTCQDTDNIDLGTLTLYFATGNEATGLPNLTLIPAVLEVTTVPTRINVANSGQNAGPLGERAKITVSLRDFPYHDRLVDKYWAERDFDPAERSTFWAKWLARNPYHQGRSLRVYDGYVGQALAEMSVRHYIIDRIEGPEADVVRIVAKDPLKLLDSERVQAPSPSNGVLAADLTDTGLAATLGPAGIGNAEYPAEGIARIGSEVLSYTRIGDALTLVSRGLRSTAASAHQAGDVVQQVTRYESVPVDIVLAELLTFSGIDPAFIPSADWAAEADLWLSGFTVSRWITEPTGIATLVGELLEQCLCFIWWDEREQTIPFRAVRPFYPLVDDLPIAVTDEATIIADSVRIEPKPDERISQVMVYYAPIDPTKGREETANYARLRVDIDQDSEEPEQYGDKRIRTIFANWLDDQNDGASIVLCARVLERFRDPPRKITFEADAKDDDLRLGRVIRMSHHGLVDFQGEIEPTLLQILAREEIDPGHRLWFEAMPYLFRTRYGLVMADGAPDFGAATDEQKLTGCFVAPDAEGFDNGDLPYRIL